MIRSASLIVILALTAPSVATLACEWLLCAGTHRAAAPATGGCHDDGATESGPSWSGSGGPCHDAADGLGDAVVTTGPTLVLAPSVVVANLPPAPLLTLHSNGLPRSRPGPPASPHATAPLRI